MFKLQNITEVLYSVGNMNKVTDLFCGYGGWNKVGSYATHKTVMDFWNLPQSCSSNELLIQFDGQQNGQLRLVKYNNVDQEYIRSSQNPWDTGGIMDINIRVPIVSKAFNDLRELGWHGLSDPLFQKMGPFELYDVLMKGYDDIIIAFTHRKQPPLHLKEGYNFPSIVYNSSIVVKNLEEAQNFYVKKLGFQLLNEYEVKKDGENMFGIPFNVISDVQCKANILSLNGTREVVFQIIEFNGVDGKDFSNKSSPPNRGLLMYRSKVKKIDEYQKHLEKLGVIIHQTLQTLVIEPYGPVTCFSIRSPNGVIWEFFEETSKI